MTITELITALDAVRVEHGDIAVIAWSMRPEPLPPRLVVEPAGNILEAVDWGTGPQMLQLN